MEYPTVRFTLPPRQWLWDFIRLSPDELPLPIPPPSGEYSLKAPFDVDPAFYRRSLQWTVPLTFATIYLSCVMIANRINRNRGFKPWAFSHTRLFDLLVITHNFVLAAYSGITCAAMVRALYVSWPGLIGSNGLPGAADSLCKMHGPRGLGDAVIFSPQTGTWFSGNPNIHLGLDEYLPDSTDVGRIWNEGLAFWGWIFYLSKFYEVVDTLILLTKGKRSPTLQTYHHAGAMLCMWSGIRYMSPPIWMFVLVNSGIHTLMYTYYALTAMGIRISGTIKKSLTSMQIAQFVVGASYAFGHLFVSYSVPVTIPYVLSTAIKQTPAKALSAASSAASLTRAEFYDAIPSVAAYARDHATAWFKKGMLLAANAPGVAYNIDHEGGSLGGRIPLGSTLMEQFEYREIHCLDTSGEAFAILLNDLYLAPLTILFLRFFYKAYIKPAIIAPRRQSVTFKGHESGAKDQKPRQISDSIADAVRRTSDAMNDLGKGFEDAVGAISQEIDTQSPPELPIVAQREVGSTSEQNIDQAVRDVRETNIAVSGTKNIEDPFTDDGPTNGIRKPSAVDSSSFLSSTQSSYVFGADSETTASSRTGVSTALPDTFALKSNASDLPWNEAFTPTKADMSDVKRRSQDLQEATGTVVNTSSDRSSSSQTGSAASVATIANQLSSEEHNDVAPPVADTLQSTERNEQRNNTMSGPSSTYSTHSNHASPETTLVKSFEDKSDGEQVDVMIKAAKEAADTGVEKVDEAVNSGSTIITWSTSDGNEGGANATRTEQRGGTFSQSDTTDPLKKPTLEE